MKKIISLVLVLVLMTTGLLALTGCEKGGNAPKKDGVDISYTFGKGKISLRVPKKEDGTAKYEFTTEKPEGFSVNATFYLVTDKAMFGFSTSSLAYNTGKEYKEKYGETQATFDGYLAFLDDESLSSRAKLSGDTRLEINGRKVVKYYNRVGSSGNYDYYGFFYLVGVDDVYPGSRLQMTVNYKDEKPKESKEFDEETNDIISSLKVEANVQ